MDGSWLKHIKLGTQLIAIILICAIMPVLTVYIQQQTQQRDLNYADAGRHLAQYARMINDSIDRILAERYNNLHSFSSNDTLRKLAEDARPDTEKQRELVDILNKLVRNYTYHKLVLYIGLDGTVRAVNTIRTDGQALDTRALYTENFTHTAWFQSILHQRFSIPSKKLADHIVVPPMRSEILAQLYHDDGWAMIFAAPVYNNQHVMIGIWANFVDFQPVENIIGEYARMIHGDKLMAASIDIRNADNTPIVGYKLLPHGLQRLAISEDTLTQAQEIAPIDIENVSQDKSWHMIRIPDHEKMIAGENISDGTFDYPGLGWRVMVAAPESELLNDILHIEHVTLRMVLLSALIIIILGICAVLYSVGTLRRMTVVMRRLAHGDLDTAIPMQGHRTELGTMAAALAIFKRNAENIKRLEIDKLRQQSALEIEKQQALAALAQSFENTVGQVVTTVTGAAEQVQDNALSLSALSDQVVVQVAQMANATDQASQNTRAVALAAEGLFSSITDISRQINEATNITRAAVTNAQETNAMVAQLSDAAKKIGDVVAFIQNIARQTNLLSLNATIEAARAGAAGKGFGVVAAEVKSLAGQTDHATTEITRQVKDIQQISHAAVAALERIMGVITRVNEITVTTEAAVQQQTTATREIARNVQESVNSADSVNTNLQDVNIATQQTGASAQELLQAARSLTDQSHHLSHALTKFLTDIRNPQAAD